MKLICSCDKTTLFFHFINLKVNYPYFAKFPVVQVAREEGPAGFSPLKDFDDPDLTTLSRC